MESEKLICAVCNEPSNLKCTGCQLVAYCGKVHQRAHWKAHKDACKPFQISNSQELGRHLIAARDIKHGDMIISELPLIIGPKTNMSYIFNKVGPCVGCYRPVDIENGARCPKCEWPICSPQCSGLQDPQHHSAECTLLRLGAGPELSRLGKRYYRYPALLLLRCLILQRKSQRKWSQLMEMKSHVEDRKEGTEAHREAEDQIGYLNENYLKVMRFMEEQSQTPILNNSSSQLMHQIAGIIDVNGLEVHLDSGLDLSALYPTVCLLEHSCLPNTSYSFEIESEEPQKRFKIYLRAAGDIKKGQHITTMYSHALWGTRARRDHLSETKYFKCTCERCRDPTELGTYLSALKCLGMEILETGEKQSCDGFQLPLDPLDNDADWACSNPDCIVRVKSSEVEQMIGQMADEVEDILESKTTISKLEEFIEKLSAFLHPRHYLLYRIQHTLIQLYGYQQGYLLQQMSEEQLQTKIFKCKELLDINSKVDPYNARVPLYSLVLLFELHITMAHLAKRKYAKEDPDLQAEAVKIVKEACEILEKCKEVLKYELQSAMGAKMNSLVQQASLRLKSFLEENSISLQNTF